MTTPSAAPQTWPWRDSPFVRIAGSAVSWFGFMLCFTLLFLTMYTVMSLGGFCASGGPYVIETECPKNVLTFTPWNIFGGMAAVALSVFFAQGFGTQLIAWAWPILFVGLSVPFFISAAYGDISGIFLGLMFLVMGLVPVYFFTKSGGLRIALVGTRNASGRNFRGDVNERAAFRLIGRRPDPDRAPVVPTAVDWIVALSISLGFGVLGVYTAMAWWAAVSA